MKTGGIFFQKHRLWRIHVIFMPFYQSVKRWVLAARGVHPVVSSVTHVRGTVAWRGCARDQHRVGSKKAPKSKGITRARSNSRGFSETETRDKFRQRRLVF